MATSSAEHLQRGRDLIEISERALVRDNDAGYHAVGPAQLAQAHFAAAAEIDRQAAVPPRSLSVANSVCCDLHSTTCEPPSELCCGACTEGRHPMHPPGVRCVLDVDPQLSAKVLQLIRQAVHSYEGPVEESVMRAFDKWVGSWIPSSTGELYLEQIPPPSAE